MIIIRNIKWDGNKKNLPTTMMVPKEEITNGGTAEGTDVAWYLASTTNFVYFPNSFDFVVR